MLEDRATPATLTVNATTDTGAGMGGAGDLRYCITQANTREYGEGETEHVINFAGNLAFGTITLQTALPNLAKNVRINGLGWNVLSITRSATADPFRIFLIGAGTTSTISNLTLTNGLATQLQNGGAIKNFGTLTVANCVLSNNSGYDGGAVANNGSLLLSNCTLEYNSANDGGALINYGELRLFQSTLSDNTAIQHGGAIRNDGTIVSMTYTGIGENTAADFGGGIYNVGQATIGLNSTVLWNTANFGGGIFNGSSATLSTDNCVIANNRATANGGGVYNEGVGGASNDGGTLTLGLSTRVDANRAGGDGGGVYMGGGQASFVNMVFVYNQAAKGGAVYAFAGTATFTNYTTISNNQAGLGPGICFAAATVSLDQTCSNQDGQPVQDNPF